jgi:hypothetical protein
MNIRGIRQLVFLLCAVVLAAIIPSLSYGAPFFFPDMNPSFVKGDSPEWLQEGRGNDGYLTITSEVIPVNTCTQMASRSFWVSLITELPMVAEIPPIAAADPPVATIAAAPRSNFAEPTKS